MLFGGDDDDDDDDNGFGFGKKPAPKKEISKLAMPIAAAPKKNLFNDSVIEDEDDYPKQASKPPPKLAMPIP